MSHRTILAIVGLLALLAASATAQTPERSFNLKRAAIADTTARAAQEAQKPRYVPGLQAGRLEASLTLGYLDLNTPMVTYPERLIYKYSTDFTYYGDVVLQGESAFNPVLRLSYSLAPWFALEGTGGISVSEYRSKITSRIGISNELDSDERILDPALGPYDGEQRSCITLSGGLSALYYPFDTGKSGEGRWHPFLIGGAGRTLYSLNSNYTAQGTSAWTLSGGGGLRFIADELVSVRFEVIYNRSRIQFDPAERFLSLNDGTLSIPLDALPDVGRPVTVTEFPEQIISALSWGIGFTAGF